MEDAKLYVHANGLQKRDAILVLREFLPKLNWNDEGDSILDVGCGSGKLILFYLRPGLVFG